MARLAFPAEPPSLGPYEEVGALSVTERLLGELRLAAGANGFSHRLRCTVLNAVGVTRSDWNGVAELTELKA
jgi:hypothetical protein